MTINTAYSERSPEGPPATFRAHLAPLARRGRGIAHGTALVESGMWLVGCAYNVCWTQESLRLRAIEGCKWLERTTAMAAGLTAHAWTLEEMLRYPIPPADPVAVPPSRRGRRRGAVGRPQPPHAPPERAA